MVREHASPARRTSAAPSAAPTSRKRIRSVDDEGGAHSAKRSDRNQSSRVQFESTLESGPTLREPDHRRVSPAKSSLRRGHGAEDEDDENLTNSDESDDSGDFDGHELVRVDSDGNEISEPDDEGQKSVRSNQRWPRFERGNLEQQDPKRYMQMQRQKQLSQSSSQSQNQPSRPTSQSKKLFTELASLPRIVEKGESNELLSHDPQSYIVLSPKPETGPLRPREKEDVIVASHFAQIVAATKAFAEAFPDPRSFIEPEFTGFKDALLGSKAHEKTIRYIGCLALGGPEGERSWLKLLSDSASRQASVMGIVGRALKEHVFSDLWFGGSSKEKQELDKIDQNDAGDGFSRTKERARKCAKFQERFSSLSKSLLQKTIIKMTLQLEELLLPLFNIHALAYSKEYKPHTVLPESHRTFLLAIVEQAAVLSRFMRQIPDVVYYWPPTFKDEEFDPQRMECLNLKDMISSSPYTKERTQQGYERAKLNAGEESRSEAIVRVVAFPGIVAYRQGGGALAKKTLDSERRSWASYPPDVSAQKEESFRREGTSDHSGFRTRLIAKAVVHLQWGRQRLLTKEAGTSRHLDAMRDGTESKYERDYGGFVELYDLYEGYQVTHESA